VDRDRILQTLTNLLSNAIKFSPAHQTIWVNVEIETDRVLIAVKDQGRGIPADKISSIFERFQQVDSSDSRNHDGTGLGLAICQSIVLQHNGQIWVESELGAGSTFYFTLPLPVTDVPLFCEQPNPILKEIRASVTHSVTDQMPLVLICNDAPSLQPMLETLLEQQGYRVLTASGRQAAVEAETHRPDVILLVGDQAWETMASLKQKETTSKIPMIVCRVSPPYSDDVEDSVVQIDEAAVFELLRQALAPVSNQIEVLIVEDDTELAEMLKILFERHGVSTVRASTGREAIRLSQQMNPDLLVLDLLLPGGDGFTVVEWLQQHSQLCHTPLVVYSVKELNRLERDRLKLGPTEFLTKGRVTIQEFEQRVMALLQHITQTTRPQS
jgi:CheY-like chemotaxis protein